MIDESNRRTKRQILQKPNQMTSALRPALQTIAFACLCAAVACSDHADKATYSYHVQLIRGSNNPEPPETNCSAIGPKLSAHLRPVFLWTNYWEIDRQEVSVQEGKKTRVRLKHQREVDIDLAEKGQRTVIAYRGDEALKTTRPIGEGMTIVGGHRDNETAWFIVVRRDKPSTSRFDERGGMDQ